ncbi:MAG: winged helix-turn-helix transcriptional regulator [Anaerolinea sp.]|nr:winged helix-turn-helix transcriptional regulator [Anaerolinea sp.]
MSTFNPTHRRDSLAGQATIALYRIGQAINHIFREQGTAHKLSTAQIQALLFLRYARPGVHTIGGLVQRMSATYATASGVVDALEGKQLVERQLLPKDQRIVTLHLTDKGVQEVEFLENMLNEIESALAELSESDLQTFIRATQSIVRRLQKAGHVQVYEMCWNCQFFHKHAHPNAPDGPHHCAFMDAPLPEPNTYLECPDFTPEDQ